MSRSSRFAYYWIAVFTIAIVVSSIHPVIASDASIKGPFVRGPVYPVSFDRDLRTLPRPQNQQHHITMQKEAPEIATGSTRRPDPVVQNWMSKKLMPATIRNFDGLDHSAGSGFPPDPNGDVGPNHYIQTVNTTAAIYDKTGTLITSFTFDDFFDGTGTPCDNAFRSDPVVLYDAMADRWLLSDFAFSGPGPFYECIAVSKTSDPVAGGWWQYGLLTDNSVLADYPKFGVWPDAYYMSGYIQPNYRVWALDRNSILAGGPLNEVHFDLSGVFFLIPSNLRGAAPPANSPNFFAAVDVFTSTALHLWKFHVDWTTPVNSTFTGPTDITVASYTNPGADIPEQSGNDLDPIRFRLMMQWQYRNFGGTESLWGNQTVDAGAGIYGIRWYEIRDPNGSPTVHQQGTYQPDTNHRWIGGLAVDQFGNMAVGYSVSSAAMFPAIRYSGRLAGDPLGTLPQGEASIIEGTGAQTGFVGNRWGDYTSMTVDPVDDCTFWYTNEYYATSGDEWKTRIGVFSFPGCLSADVTITKTAGPDPVVRGTNITYTLTATNNGPTDAQDMVIADATPVDTTFVSATPDAGGVCVTPAVGATGAITCTYAGATASGVSHVVTIVVKVDPDALSGTLITNAATVSSTTPDPFSLNNTASTTVTVAALAKSTAIDPLGRFVLFTTDGFGCVNFVLTYQAIHADGSPAGAPVQLVPCGAVGGDVVGIDLVQDGNEYWVSFGGSFTTESKYLMKINASGAITKPSKDVVKAASFGSTSGATALSLKGKDKLFLWIAGGSGAIYRAQLDKATLALLSMKKLSISTSNTDVLQVTQGATKYFLAMERPVRIFKGFGLTSKGLPDTTSWRLSPHTEGGHETGSVSADGRMALSNDANPPADQLYIQPLGTDGHATGQPVVVSPSNAGDIESADVSNTLTGKRFVVYFTDTGLYLQMVDASTGMKIGSRLLLYP